MALLSLGLGTTLFAQSNDKSFTDGFFVEPTVNLSKSSTKNILGTSSSYTRYAGVKLGKTNESFRYYLDYDYVGWKNADAKLYSANFEYFMPVEKLFNSKLYIGANAGFTNIDGDYSGTKTKENFGVQAGVLKQFNGNAFLDFGYRYVNTQNIEAKGASSFMKMGSLSAVFVGLGWKW